MMWEARFIASCLAQRVFSHGARGAQCGCVGHYVGGVDLAVLAGPPMRWSIRWAGRRAGAEAPGAAWAGWLGVLVRGAGLVGPRAGAPALVTLSEHGNPYSGKIGVLITGLFRIALMAYLTLYRNPGSGAAQMAGTGRAGAVCGARRTGGTAAARAAGEGLAAPRRERPGPAPGTPPRAPGGAGVITPVAAAGRSPWVRPAATVRGAHTPGGAARRPPARPGGGHGG